MQIQDESYRDEDVLTVEPIECIDTEQVDLPDREQALQASNSTGNLLAYALFGVLFGLILVKSEVVSWFRIQEMFRFDSFHMYGIIGSAIVVAAIGLQLIKRLDVRTVRGERIVISKKSLGSGIRFGAGGILFGIGWALVGACPGPLFALAGSGVTVIVVALVSALAGTWTYGVLRAHLPH